MTIPFYQTHSDTNAPNYVDYCLNKYWVTLTQSAARTSLGCKVGLGGGSAVGPNPFFPIMINECDATIVVPTYRTDNYGHCCCVWYDDHNSTPLFFSANGPRGNAGFSGIRVPCRTVYDRCNCLVTGFHNYRYNHWIADDRWVTECASFSNLIGGGQLPTCLAQGSSTGIPYGTVGATRQEFSGNDSTYLNKGFQVARYHPQGEYHITAFFPHSCNSADLPRMCFCYQAIPLTREDWVDKNCYCVGWGCADPLNGSHNNTFIVRNISRNNCNICTGPVLLDRGNNQFNLIYHCVCGNNTQFWLGATTATKNGGGLIPSSYCSSWCVSPLAVCGSTSCATDHVISLFCVNADCIQCDPVVLESHSITRGQWTTPVIGMFYDVRDEKQGYLYTKSILATRVFDKTWCCVCLANVPLMSTFLIDRANCCACAIWLNYGAAACCHQQLESDFVYTNRGTWVALSLNTSAVCRTSCVTGVMLTEFTETFTPISSVWLTMTNPGNTYASVCSWVQSAKLEYYPYDDSVIVSIGTGGTRSSEITSEINCCWFNTGHNLTAKLPSCVSKLCETLLCSCRYSAPPCCLSYTCCCAAIFQCLCIGESARVWNPRFNFYPACAQCVQVNFCYSNTYGVATCAQNPMCTISTLSTWVGRVFGSAGVCCTLTSVCMCDPAQFNSLTCFCYRRFERPAYYESFCNTFNLCDPVSNQIGLECTAGSSFTRHILIDGE